MCGIAGIYRPGGKVFQEELEAMAHAIGHRGPDGSATWVGGPIGLAHTRLRVVDLSDRAAQPMRWHGADVRIVYNGEMYNFRAARAALVARGVELRSSSDTEVLLATYMEHGDEMFQQIEGMFAFAIWDQRCQRLLLARDRAGEKPLFYKPLAGGGVAFASEIKALCAVRSLGVTRDLSRIPSYLMSGFVPPPRTFYEGVFQLPPAHVVTFREGKSGAPSRYWTPRFTVSPKPPTFADAKRELRSRMREIVRRRLDADVPVGAFLSGGLDSATVVGVATRDLGRSVRTFSIGVDDPALDESADAKRSAAHLGSQHEELRISAADVPSVETLVHHHDGPFADSSAIPTYLVSKLARSRVTVVVTGDGGDEIFGGYPSFVGGRLGELFPGWAGKLGGSLSRVVKPSHPLWGTRSRGSPLAKAARLVAAVERPLGRRMLHWSSVFALDTLPDLVRPGLRGEAEHAADVNDAVFAESAGESPLARILHHNFRTQLPDDLLVKLDRCSMAVSLEARSPLLDSSLIEFVGGLPDDFKIRGLRTKHILRETFADLLTPEVLARPKRGFGIPLASWLSGPLRAPMEDAIRTESAEIYRHLDRQTVERMLWPTPDLDAQRALQAWSLWTLETWLRSPLGVSPEGSPARDALHRAPLSVRSPKTSSRCS